MGLKISIDKKCLAFFEMLVTDANKLLRTQNFDRQHKEFTKHASVKANAMSLKEVVNSLSSKARFHYQQKFSAAETNLLIMQLYEVFYDDKKANLSAILEKLIFKRVQEKMQKQVKKEMKPSLFTHIPFFAKPIQIQSLKPTSAKMQPKRQ